LSKKKKNSTTNKKNRSNLGLPNRKNRNPETTPLKQNWAHPRTPFWKTNKRDQIVGAIIRGKRSILLGIHIGEAAKWPEKGRLWAERRGEIRYSTKGTNRRKKRLVCVEKNGMKKGIFSFWFDLGAFEWKSCGPQKKEG